MKYKSFLLANPSTATASLVHAENLANKAGATIACPRFFPAFKMSADGQRVKGVLAK